MLWLTAGPSNTRRACVLASTETLTAALALIVMLSTDGGGAGGYVWPGLGESSKVSSAVAGGAGGGACGSGGGSGGVAGGGVAGALAAWSRRRPLEDTAAEDVINVSFLPEIRMALTISELLNVKPSSV